ncbi:GNAT family N-acetyltransferase [Paenarthrobacter histidinolovorans]|uniref:RimJ/RimL family protein N-acetyltransferase n=1 Tax=Paenarthrobacter histidinolovorans TaxID=43664 RepID=A0ABW8N202_9MICC|nr:GNAT family protein [Paenarthrobacter histidinolovorans]GGJ12891.1 acetyltransferase [Paenarthrobacter histidinolovorans]
MPEIELPIVTDRLILRRFVVEDLERFHEYQALPETARFLFRHELTKTRSMEVLGRYANFEFNQEGDWVCLAIERQDQPGLVGEVVLKWLEGTGQGELGWILHPDARGHGYATEAAEAVLRLAFEHLSFHRVDAKLDALNEGSAAVCHRLGMRLEATLVDNWHYKGQWATENIYAILDSEWRNRHRPWTRSVS